MTAQPLTPNHIQPMRVVVQLLAVLKEQGGNVRCCCIFRPACVEYSRVHFCCDQHHVTELRPNLSLLRGTNHSDGVLIVLTGVLTKGIE